MRWFEASKHNITAANPFAFGPPAGPTEPGPVAPPSGGPRPPGGPSAPSRTTEKSLEQFENKDQHIRSIMKQLSAMDAGRLATLSDAMGQGDAFWNNLSVSQPTPAEPAAPMGTEVPSMPSQSQGHTPAGPVGPVGPVGPMDRALTPGQQNIQDYLQTTKTPAAPAISQPGVPANPNSYDERLKANRPLGPQMPRKKPGAHFE